MACSEVVRLRRMDRYRVDNVPRAFRPLYIASAWTLGATLHFYYFVCRLTSRVVLEEPGDADLSQPAYAIPDAVRPYYGAHPWGVNVYARFRLR